MNAPLVQGSALAHDSALGHVTGQAPFADDVPEAPGLLHGALLLSPVAHGRLGALDVAAARAMPGIVAVLTARDVPGANDISPSGREVEPLFAEAELRHHGQPIALVVGESRDAALAALGALKPEIEALPAIRAATKLPLIFDSGIEGGLDILRALALGADFVMLGRAFHFALGALGPKGVDHLIDILAKDMASNMGQIGARTLSELPATIPLTTS